MKHTITLGYPFLLFLFGILIGPSAFSQESTTVRQRFVVKSSGSDQTVENQVSRQSLNRELLGVTKIGNIEVWEVDVKKYAQKNPEVQAVSFVGHMKKEFGIEIEPDYSFSSFQAPDDPYFSDQWAAAGTGNNHSDIGLKEAWEISQGGEGLVAGIIDTGIDYGHEDLKENIWQNLAEDADGDGTTIEWVNGAWALDPGDLDGIDADGNGYVDDLVGWDFVNNDNDPFDDNGHGTHVAGILGAKGNNGTGVAGVCWSVKMMALKAFDSRGSGSLSSILPALEYARSMGSQFTNNSWGGSSYSEFLYEKIEEANEEGQLVITAAGNMRTNLERSPVYPASYDLPNIISVAATDQQDRLASFSNHGVNDVDLTAPGVSMISTLPDNQYGLKSGTSMATPMVAGVVGLIWTHKTELGHLAIKDLLLTTVDRQTSLKNKCATGGRINAYKALQITSDLCEDWVKETKGYKIKSITADGLYIWAATDKGLLRLEKSSCGITHFDKKNSPLDDDHLLCVAKGENGILWIGSEKKGLYKIENGVWTNYTKKNSGLTEDKISAIAITTSGIWVGTDKEGLTFYDGTSWINYDKHRGDLPNDKIKSMVQGPDGSLWVGTDKGTARFKDGQWTVLDMQNSPLPSDKIKSVSLDFDETVWIGTDKGLASWGAGAWEIWKKGNSNLPEDKVYAISFGNNSAKWFGTKKGLARYNGVDWVLIDKKSKQLPHDAVNALYTDELNNTWIGTDDGIQLFSNQVSVSFSGPSSACIGQPIEFTNHSFGADTYQWIINGALIGTDEQLTYQFTETGEQEVKLIGVNTYSNDEYVLIIDVPESPVSDLGNDTSICAPALILDAGTNSHTYLWQDLDEEVLGREKTLAIQQSGTYILTLTNQCSARSVDTLQLTLTPGCVRPGDVNADGKVNMIDYLALGSADGLTGPARSTQSSVSSTQSAADWASSFASTHQLAADVNHKHADCDGDGLVDLELDGEIIQQQASHIHEIDHEFDPNGLELSLEPMAKIFEGDSIVRLTYEISLSGSAGSSVSGVHALSLGLAANYQLAEAPVISTEGSWLGTPSSMVIHHGEVDQHSSSSLSVQRLGGAYSEVGMIRKGRTGGTGAGFLASASIVISIDDITEDPNLMEFFSFSLAPLNVMVLDSEGNAFPIQAAQGSELSTTELLSDSSFERPQSTIQETLLHPLSVYPNPAKDLIQLEYTTGKSANMNLKVWSMIGTLVYQSGVDIKEGENLLELPTNTWMEGIYILELIGNEGRIQTKVQVMR